MVDQLWLWTICRDHTATVDMETEQNDCGDARPSDVRKRRDKAPKPRPDFVISSFPSRHGSQLKYRRTHDDLRHLVLDPVDHKRDPIVETEDLVARILEACCNIFDRLQNAETLQFIQMFATAIGNTVSQARTKLYLTLMRTQDDNETRLFKAFRNGLTRLQELDKTSKYYNRDKITLLKGLLDIRREIELLVEIKDTRDEINIVLSLLNVQKTLVEELCKTSSDGRCYSPLQKTIKDDMAEFTTMDSQAKNVQDKVRTSRPLITMLTLHRSIPC